MPSNPTVVLYGKDDLRLEERPIKVPGPGEVQLAIHSVGICGTDIHYYAEGKAGEFLVKDPMVLGHESSGVVTIVGDGVKHLKVGDRVAIDPGVLCHKCEYCKVGRNNLCPHAKCLGLPPIDGDLSRFLVHAAEACHKLPDHVSFDEGALMEPLSVGIHACRRSNLHPGQKVLICGSGTIGLVCLVTAKAMGASDIIMTDISDHRLEFAKKMGADFVYKIDPKLSPEATAEKIRGILGDHPEITMECTGFDTSIQTGVFATKSGGILALVGLGKVNITFPIVNAAIREVDVRGVFRFTDTYPTAMHLVASGAVNIKPLVTHHFKLDQFKKAFDTARTASDGALKVVIDCTA